MIVTATVSSPTKKTMKVDLLTAPRPPASKLNFPSADAGALPVAPAIKPESSSEADSRSMVSGAAMLTASRPERQVAERGADQKRQV